MDDIRSLYASKMFVEAVTQVLPCKTVHETDLGTGPHRSRVIFAKEKMRVFRSWSWHREQAGQA